MKSKEIQKISDNHAYLLKEILPCLIEPNKETHQMWAILKLKYITIDAPITSVSLPNKKGNKTHLNTHKTPH